MKVSVPKNARMAGWEGGTGVPRVHGSGCRARCGPQGGVRPVLNQLCRRMGFLLSASGSRGSCLVIRFSSFGSRVSDFGFVFSSFGAGI